MSREDPPGGRRGRPARRRATRRRLLRAGGLAGVALLSGCTGDVGDELPPNDKRPVSGYVPELPVTQRSSILAERIRVGADAGVESEADLEGAFEEHSLEIESVDTERDVLTVEYVTTERYVQGALHDVGVLAGAYASIVDAGVDTVAMDVTILDDAPESYGAAEVDTAWALGYNDGTLTAEEYGELVGTTVETKRDSPDVAVEPSE